jgi:hypothetical protein
MIRRHIDIIAVSVIALGLLALSNTALVLPIQPNTIRVENISSALSGCPVSVRIVSTIDRLVNR